MAQHAESVEPTRQDDSTVNASADGKPTIETDGIASPETHKKICSNGDEVDDVLSLAAPKGSKRSSQLIYKVHYRNTTSGDIIQQSQSDKPFPNFLIGDEADVEEETDDPALEVKHVVDMFKASKGAKDTSIEGWKTLHVRTTLIIHSQGIIDALRSLVDYYPKAPLSGETMELDEPYIFLLQHRNELVNLYETYSENLERSQEEQDVVDRGTYDRKIRDHIGALRGFLDSNYKKKIEAEERRHNPPRDKPATATFQMLWMLFKPGTKVYSKVQDQFAGFVVKSIRRLKDRISFWDPYKLTLWNLDFDGRRIGRHKRTIIIYPFDGEMEITMLPAYPIHMATDKPDKKTGLRLKEKLEQRGEKYFNILKVGSMQVDYDGESLGDDTRWIRGRVILDSASGYTYNDEFKRPEVGQDIVNDNKNHVFCTCKVCQPRGVEEPNKTDEWPKDHKPPKPFLWEGYDNIDPMDKNTKLGPEHYFLLPRRMLGFILKTRTWAALDIDNATPFISNKDAIKTLVMDEKQLKLIKALSFNVGSREGSWAADFIQSKGEGQIFLLHGPPGVGKTYTAECIAEFTQRPLLCLTCADIGITETAMEQKLMNWFTLAENWGAVMLIDEADVYLEVRQTGDLTRNSLVSAFLRSMEYYRGILFLTTNRIGKIDDAIMSRIHIVLGYKVLQSAERDRIWQQFFDKLERDRADIDVDPRAVKYVKDQFIMKKVLWNGREIRNAFQTAVALAEYDAKMADPPEKTIVLRKMHFEQVVEISQTFKTYMKESFGSEAKRALDEGTRSDYPLKTKTSLKGKSVLGGDVGVGWGDD